MKDRTTQPPLESADVPAAECPFALDASLIADAKLNYERIFQHQNRIWQSAANKVSTSLAIVGACTTNNGGIVPWKTLSRFASGDAEAGSRRARQSAHAHWRSHHVVTCIPAAGAASRFLALLQRYVQEVEATLPFLKDASEAFFVTGKTLKLETGQENSLKTSLLNIKLTPDIADTPEKIRQQKHTSLKVPLQNFNVFLVQIITQGEGEPVSGLGDNGSHMQSTQDSQTEAMVRIHWLAKQEMRFERLGYEDGAMGGSHLDAPAVPIKNQHAHTRKSNVHWMTRLASERDTVSSAIDIEPGRSRVFLGTHEKNVIESYAACKILLHKFSHLPKAFVATTLEGDSFLRLKLTEQVALFPTLGNVLISPAGQQEAFVQEIDKEGRILPGIFANIFDLKPSPFAPPWVREPGQKSGSWQVLEQGFDLSTIRFNLDGSPFLDAHSRYSPVAAGHGELVHLFESIANAFPEAECLHVRNIDNIVGTTPDRCAELAVPAEAFRLIRDSIELIRARLDDFLQEQGFILPDTRLIDRGVFGALRYLSSLIEHTLPQDIFAESFSAQGDFIGVTHDLLHKVLGNLFHWPILEASPIASAKANWEAAAAALARPLSIFGVVRKEVGDVGGGPVFARLQDNTTVKICMEMPHASHEDSKEFFGTKGRATHFNPVLVFFELRTHKRSFSDRARPGKLVNFSHLFDDRFWLLAHKEYQGKPVCYHETVLYELIGNSATTNVLFVEVPRTLFNPHKTIFESLGQDRRSYGFNETLKSADGI